MMVMIGTCMLMSVKEASMVSLIIQCWIPGNVTLVLNSIPFCLRTCVAMISYFVPHEKAPQFVSYSCHLYVWFSLSHSSTLLTGGTGNNEWLLVFQKIYFFHYFHSGFRFVIYSYFGVNCFSFTPFPSHSNQVYGLRLSFILHTLLIPPFILIFLFFLCLNNSCHPE